MASKIINTGLKRTALSVALGMCFAGSVLAQSNSTGSIAGTTDAGATVTIENPATGFKREITAGSDGQYRVGSLPTGTYKVTTKGQTRNVSVTIGGTATGSATDVAGVTVTGGGTINAIDVSSVESTTILTAEQIAKIPVGRNITGVALLAPGTVRGDAAFGNLASFGGSSVAENAYFVNGFNITNAFKNLNFAQIPFEAIAEQQVKTGGYGAEFGRSTGGVINLVTKRGTNEFHAGGNIFINPNALRGSNPNVYTPGGNTSATAYAPTRLYSNNTQDESGNVTTAAVWASGALIQDRLFAYALLQYGKMTGANSYGVENSLTNTSSSNEAPTWLLKMDWNISDNHLLELTAFSDVTKTETIIYNNLNPLFYINGVNGNTARDANRALVRTNARGTVYDKEGGESYSLKYTGYLTDNFTLSALYGHGESSRSNYAETTGGQRISYNGNVGTPPAGCPWVQDSRTAGAVTPLNSCYVATTLGSDRAKDQRDQFRIDAEWQLGDHLLRAGFDGDRFKSYDAESTAGGVRWIYFDGNYVLKRVFQSGAQVEVDSQAFYLEDKWQITDNFLAYVGLRWDNFANKNGAGDKYVEIKNQFGPRLGFSWDVNGDGKFKVFGNAGRYALPLTATVGVRGASASLFTDQAFNYVSTNPTTGEPIGLTPYVGPGNDGQLHYLNNEFGVAKDASVIASQNLKPMYQDEYILGFQAQLTDNISGGVRGIYRDLKRAIDDQCDQRAIAAWALANGFTNSDGNFSNPKAPTDPATDLMFVNRNMAACHLFNPGSDLEVYGDVNNDGKLEYITVPASLISPKAERTYKALEFFAEGQWDKFFVQGSYTWAKSAGNTEGGVKSDIGQDDTGTTQDFDYPELVLGSNGNLPNDRRHSFKVFGNYEINDEWSVGANLLVQSGRPINCFGVYGTDPVQYGASYFSCNPVGVYGIGSTAAYTTVNNRGTGDRTPWTRTLDLNIAWSPAFADGKLTFKADVFNVFDDHGVTAVREAGESGTGAPLYATTYKTPLSWQAPRSFRFMVQYDY